MLRKSNRLTQVDLAERIGISQGSLSDIEKGRTVEISGSTLESLCRHLTATPSFIMHGVRAGESHESAMQESELLSIFRELPPQAQDALMHSARTVRQAIPKTSPAQPLLEDRGRPAKASPKSKSKI